MSYIGNNPEVNVFTAKVDKFSGDGACTEFTLSRTLDDANAILVIVNSVVQTPISSYSIANGVMTFTEAPSSGTENIVVNYTSPITLTFNQINESQIQANTVSETQLAPNSVSSTKIKPNAVTGDKMANNSIRANNIVANQITGDKLANNAIRGNNIVAGTITNNLFATGAITADLISGAFSATQGGTGFTSYTVGDILFANTTTSLTTLPAVDAGNVLRSAGVGAHPTYGKVNLATDTTGNLPIGNLGDGTSASQFTFWRGDGSWSKVSLVNNIVGNLPTSNLNGGSGATATTFWRGDGTWATPASSGDVTGPVNAPDNSVVRFDGTTGKIIQATTGATFSDSGQATFTGYLYINGTSASPAVVRLHEESDIGVDYIEIKAPSSLSANVVLTLPDNDGTAANQAMITDGSGLLTFGAINLASSSCATGNLPVINLGGGTGANNTSFWRGDGSWSRISLASHVTGNLAVTSLNGGTSASASTFWRGDGQWASPASGSGNVAGPSGSSTNAIAIFNDTTGTKIWNNALANVNASAFIFSSGASVSGTVSAARFSGVGTALTSLNGDNISSGTVSASRLPTAATNASGIVTSGDQQFGGKKRFPRGLTVNAADSASGGWSFYAENDSTGPAVNAWNSGSGGYAGNFMFYNGISNPIVFQSTGGTGPAGALTVAGSISGSGSTVAYNTSSDYRLKENIVPLTDAITKLKLLSPKRFTWKNFPEEGIIEGFIAHEVQEIVPSAISGVKDAVDANGKIIPQGIDSSFLIPLLTAALQEAIVRIEALEARSNT